MGKAYYLAWYLGGAIVFAMGITGSFLLARLVDSSLGSAEERVYTEAAGFVAERSLSLFATTSSTPTLVDALGFVNVTSPEDFDALSDKQANTEGISQVVLLRRVDPSLADSAAAELSEKYNMTIDLRYMTDRDVEGDLFVAEYVFPRNDAIPGLVVNSEESRADAIDTAVQSGEPTFVDSVALADTGELGRLAFYPIISRSPWPSSVDNLFTMVIRYNDLFEPFVPQLESTSTDSEIEVFVEGNRVFDSNPQRDLDGDNSMRFASTGIDMLVSEFDSPEYSDVFVYLVVSGAAIVTSLAVVLLLLNGSRVRAERYSRLKSRFIADVSHEIRTPMNGILGMSELLAEMNLDATSRYYVKTISSCGATLLALINDILDMSKIEAGLLEIREDTIRLQTVVESTVENIWVAYKIEHGPRKKLEVILEFAAGVPEKIVGDGFRIQQVLSNLLTNSLKFTNAGFIKTVVSCVEEGESKSKFRARRPRVKARARAKARAKARATVASCVEEEEPTSRANSKPSGKPRANSKRFICVSVQDTGCGMTPEGAKAAFDAFKQVHTRTDVGGTGLGLSICRQLCGLMGGEIAISSALGVGTTVTFKVEAKPSPPGGSDRTAPPRRNVYKNATVDDAERLHDNNPSSSASVSDALEPIRAMEPLENSKLPKVLVVDDVLINRKVLSRIIQSLGVVADTCDNGLQAVERCDVCGYSLILMDMVMPVMDGVDACAQIRSKNTLNRETPVVFVSANVQSDLIARCEEVGGSGFVTKPVSKAKIVEVFTTHCSPEEKESLRRYLNKNGGAHPTTEDPCPTAVVPVEPS